MRPELLSPAGSLKMMDYAFAYGADAVYVGQPRYSLRVRNNEFNRIENLKKAADKAHSLGKQLYLACNISPHNDKVRSFIRDMREVLTINPDALIMSDPGLIMLVRERWPDVPVHLSVQANVVNYATVKFWEKQGIRRIILSRELSLDEIEQIRQNCPDIELEVFIHGALCIAYSGRCLLSGYIKHRDSNQGACTNSCRWKYQAHDAVQSETGEIIPVAQSYQHDCCAQSDSCSIESNVDSSSLFLLQERGRPSEYMPAYEDEHGTYIMNSKDLRAVQHVKRLYEIGVDSFKIEGRTKSHFYVARTSQVYRRAIEDAVNGKEFNFSLLDCLDSLSNRGYTEGFYRRHVPSEFQNYKTGNSVSTKQQFVGEVIGFDREKGEVLVDVKNKITLNDQVELMTPRKNLKFYVQKMCDKQGCDINVAPGSGHQVKLYISPEIDPENGLLMKNLDVALGT